MRNSLNVNLIFLILVSLFGNLFVKFVLFVDSFFLYVLLLFNFVYYLFQDKTISYNKIGTVRKYFYLFIIISATYILLSSLSYISFFQISDFKLRKNYILRQAYFVPFLFFLGSNIIYDLNREDNPLKTIDKHAVIITIFLLLGSLIMSTFVLPEVTQSYATHLVISSSCLFICSIKKKKLLGLVLLVSYLAIFLYGATGTVMTSLFVLYYFKVTISKYLKLITISTLVLVGAIIIANEKVTLFLLQNDPNSWWRLVYWTHEIGILKSTFFIGVGFGTPYSTQKIFNLIGEFNVIEKSTLTLEDMSYLVGQHNSFVNLFYRLGILGGLTFCCFNYYILKYSARIIRILRLNNNLRDADYVIWAEFTYICSSVIILFNVGLETPRYFIPYVISVFFLIGLINRYSNLEAEPVLIDDAKG